MLSQEYLTDSRVRRKMRRRERRGRNESVFHRLLRLESLEERRLLTTLPDALEPNDSFENATDFGTVLGTVVISDLTIHENVDGNANVDFYRFETTGPGTSAHYLEIQFAHSTGDLDMPCLMAPRISWPTRRAWRTLNGSRSMGWQPGLTICRSTVTITLPLPTA